MKKFVSVILCMLMLCGLTACSKSNTSSEFSSYYINAEANTDKDNFEKVEVVENSDENKTNEENVSNNNEVNTDNSTNNSTTTNVSDNTNNNSNNNNNSEVVSDVTTQQPVVETPNISESSENEGSAIPDTPSVPQYKTLKLYEKTKYHDLVGCFVLESELYTFDVNLIDGLKIENMGDIQSEYYVYDTKEKIYFVYITDYLPGFSDSYFEEIYEAMNTVPVIIEK